MVVKKYFIIKTINNESFKFRSYPSIFKNSNLKNLKFNKIF